MILIADSGSTKADWIAGSDGSAKIDFQTRGMNPFFHDRKFIIPELESNETCKSIKSKITQLYFFGAGCSSESRNEIIREALSAFFTNANIIVDHDMLGSAIAVCEGKPGIACILGTGSNTCYFDGKNIAQTRHGLGYILGDEGSGSYYGKKLLAWYVYKILPSDLDTAFKEKYALSKEDIISKVYHQPDPNVFIASFARFLSDHSDHPFIIELVERGMKEFFETNVLSYPESKIVPVHFVGSIAWHFREILKKVAEEYYITTGNIIQKPISGLANYFFSGGKMP